MNKTIKILLLFVGVLLAVGAIMFYVKTIVSPPQDLHFSNQYLNNLKKEVGMLRSNQTPQSVDSLYIVITDELQYQCKEKYIAQQERDEIMKEFAGLYIPLFIKDCDNKFENSVWFESDHKCINERISELKSLTINDGAKKIVEGEVENNLNKISSTINSYYKAKGIAKQTRYSGINNAKTIIAEARSYAQMAPLSNCIELVNSLNAVAGKIEQSHYNHLVSRVRQVEYYSNWYKSEWNSYKSFAENVLSELNEYKNNTNFYGTHHDVNSLIKRRNDAVNDSYYNYFETE